MHAAYIRQQPGARKAVLMIHGICSTPRHFDWLLPAFDESWSVYNILLDGHGGCVQDFSRTSMKKWKAQTCDMLNKLCEQYDKVLLVGYSMGTLLQLWALPQYPKICGMLLLNVPMRPWVRGRMMMRGMRFTRGRVNENDPHEAACIRDISIQLTPNLLQYLGWAPRFLELLQLCRHCRRHSKNISVPCYAYFGGQDELVSLRSKKYLENEPRVTVRIFDTAGHFYFSPQDRSTVLQDLDALLELS